MSTEAPPAAVVAPVEGAPAEAQREGGFKSGKLDS
jgi:hypothetical protein